MTKNTYLTRSGLLTRSFDGVSEMITGRLQGPWAVRAGVCEHCPDIRVIIFGGEWSRSGVNIGDQSVTLAGDDWQPLVTEAVTEMQRRTGRPISINCTQILGVGDNVDDDEFKAVAKEALNILSALANGPPPTPVH
jgi:hypothetical protein